MPRSPGRYPIYGLLDPRDACLRYIRKTHKRREHRLREHLEAAEEGAPQRVYTWIRELLSEGKQPHIFVLARIPGSASWRHAERAEIAAWRSCRVSDFPYTHPPQTMKSAATYIRSVALLNVREGG